MKRFLAFTLWAIWATPTVADPALDALVAAYPDHLAGQAVTTAVSHDGKTLLILTSGFNRMAMPKGKPALILMDELLNYLNRERNRKAGLGGQLYSFVQNLSEEARAQDNVVLAVSLPSVVDEMTPEDEADFQRFEKLLDRVGKAMIMSAESETSEIIRRRLFEWGGLPDDAKK